MHAELKDYIKIEKSFLDAETCKSVIASLKDVNWNEHQFYEASTNEYNNKSGNQELDVSFDSTVYTKIIMDKLWNSIKQYKMI